MKAFLDAYSQPYWRQVSGIGPADSPAALAGRYALPDADVRREHRGGVAFVVFWVDAARRGEHGLGVVYHPDRPAEWATGDGLDDLLRTDESDPTSTPE